MDPGTLVGLAGGFQLLSGVLGAVQSIQQGQAAAAAGDFNARILEERAQQERRIAQQEAKDKTKLNRAKFAGKQTVEQRHQKEEMEKEMRKQKTAEKQATVVETDLPSQTTLTSQDVPTFNIEDIISQQILMVSLFNLLPFKN